MAFESKFNPWFPDLVAGQRFDYGLDPKDENGVIDVSGESSTISSVKLCGSVSGDIALSASPIAVISPTSPRIVASILPADTAGLPEQTLQLYVTVLPGGDAEQAYIVRARNNLVEGGC